MGLVWCILWCIVCGTLIPQSEGRRTGIPDIDYVENLVYTPIQGAPCIRLLTSEGEVGCGSPETGAVGKLRFVNTTYVLEEVVKDTSNHEDTILLIPMKLWKEFSEAVKGKSFAGILLGGGVMTSHSDDDVFPNKPFGLYPNSPIPWNPEGSGLSNVGFPYPIFLVLNSSEWQNLVSLSTSPSFSSSSYPWYAELNSFMFSSGNSFVCLRRGFCEPLGGQSVLASFGPLLSERKTVFALSGMDTTALFHDLAVGSVSEMSSVAVLLTAFAALQPTVVSHPPSSQIVFAFLNGEAYGFLGSKRLVADLSSFRCEVVSEDGGSCVKPYKHSLKFLNISFEAISHLVEMKQVSLPCDRN